MARKVRYIGPSNFREISAADWKSIGVEDQGKVVWNKDDIPGDQHHHANTARSVMEISDTAWDAIQSKGMGGEFELDEGNVDSGAELLGNEGSSEALSPAGAPGTATTPATGRRVRDTPQA